MSELGPVIVRRTVTAPQEQVWQMLVDDALRASWWPELQLRPEIGAPVESGDLAGAVDVVVNELTLGFRWRRPDDESDRTVVLMLRPEDDNFDHTRITVIESGFAVLPNAAEAVQASTSEWEVRYDALITATTREGAESDGAHSDGAPADDKPAAPGDDAVSGETVPSETAFSGPDTDAEADDDVVDDDVCESDVTEDGVTEDDATEIEVTEIDVTQGDEVGVFTAEVETDAGDRDIIEIVTEEVVDAETIDETEGIYLPEVSGAPFTESVVQITSDLGVSESVEVDETSEWERLLRGDTLDGDR